MFTSLKEKILTLNNSTCPWWLCLTFDNPIRHLLHTRSRFSADWSGRARPLPTSAVGWAQSVGCTRPSARQTLARWKR